MGVFFAHAKYLCTWVEDQDALAAPRVGNNLLLYKIWVNILFFWYLQVWLEVAMGWNWAVIGAVKVAIKECLKRWTARGHCARALWAGAKQPGQTDAKTIFFHKFNSFMFNSISKFEPSNRTS